MALAKFRNLFGSTRMVVIGMIHVKPLPGTPKSSHSMEELVENAIKEADIYRKAKLDAILIENMHDLPYLHSSDFGPEVVAAMTRISTEVRNFLPFDIPCGIQILAGGNKEALAVSKACGLQFIRSEGFVFSHVADEGWIDACAGKLLRYRKSIDCENVLIFADIKKKHSAHAVTSDVSVKETAKAADFFLADGVIITGAATGDRADPQYIEEVKSVSEIPVLIGSGVSLDHLENLKEADGLIVGSHFKELSRWDSDLSLKKVCAFMEKVKELRNDLWEPQL